MSQYIMAIDQGTTGTTISLVDKQGKIILSQDEDFEQIFPKPGWVEHRPEDIWRSVGNNIKALLHKGRVEAQQIAAIGITNQRETVVVWDAETHKPVYNAIVWQCRRTSDFCETLKKQKKQKLIQSKTGLVIDPYFSASKIRWILKNISEAKSLQAKKRLRAGTIDTYLLWKLTDGKSFKTDVSNASRTQLMNIHKGQWDKDLLKLFSVSEEMLPQISPSSGVFGHTKNLGFLPDGIPVAGIAGDQQSALFGQNCFSVGEAKCTFGTGSFLLLNTGHKAVASKSGLLTTVAWQLPGQKMVYAIEGGAFVCGAAVQWLRDGLGFFRSSSEVESLAQTVTSTEGVEFVPALTGLGAPYWDAQARGTIMGLTRGTTRAHIARATLEAMALQNVDILLAMQKDLGKKIKHVRVDGGASQNKMLMQMQADYLGVRVERPEQVETTSMGAAFLAGLGVGFWKNLEEIQRVWHKDCEFDVHWTAKQRGTRLKQWHQAIGKVLT